LASAGFSVWQLGHFIYSVSGKAANGGIGKVKCSTGIRSGKPE
jgi:hypothetical protein